MHRQAHGILWGKNCPKSQFTHHALEASATENLHVCGVHYWDMGEIAWHLMVSPRFWEYFFKQRFLNGDKHISNKKYLLGLILLSLYISLYLYISSYFYITLYHMLYLSWSLYFSFCQYIYRCICISTSSLYISLCPGIVLFVFSFSIIQ